MKMYVSEKPGNPIVILKPETSDEVTILNNLERVLAPLRVQVLHGPGYGPVYLQIRKEKPCEPQVPNP